MSSYCKNNDFLLGRISNADDTPIFFDMPSSQAVHKMGKHQVTARTAGMKKSWIIIMLACTADAESFLRTSCLNARQFQWANHFCRASSRDASRKGGWQKSSCWIGWRLHGVESGVSSMPPGRAGPYWSCSHLTEAVKKLEEEKTKLVIIPRGMTSQLRPLDVCRNKPLKDYVQCLYNKWMSSDSVAQHCHQQWLSGSSTPELWYQKNWLLHPSADAVYRTLLMDFGMVTSRSMTVTKKTWTTWKRVTCECFACNKCCLSIPCGWVWIFVSF